MGTPLQLNRTSEIGQNKHKENAIWVEKNLPQQKGWTFEREMKVILEEREECPKYQRILKTRRSIDVFNSLN